MHSTQLHISSQVNSSIDRYSQPITATYKYTGVLDATRVYANALPTLILDGVLVMLALKNTRMQSFYYIFFAFICLT